MTEFTRRVPEPTRCHIRTGLAKAQQQYQDANPQGEMTGLLWGVTVQSD